MSTKPRIVYFGSSDLSAKVLRDLFCCEKFNIEAVFTQPDRPFGRKKLLKAPPVKEMALEFGLRVEQPQSMKKLAPLHQLRQINPDFGVVVAYGQILPQRILDTARFAFLNGHASNLPRWRGAAPMERCLIEGDSSTAMCIMDMTAGLDEGDVLSREVNSIASNWTIRELVQWMWHSCSDQLIKTLEKMDNFDSNRLPQSSAGINYASKISRQDAWVDLNASGQSLFNRWRALRDHYGLVFKYQDKKLIVWDLEWFQDLHDVQPGTVVKVSKDQLIIALKGGRMNILEVQLEGKKRLSVNNFLAGAVMSEGDLLEGFGECR